MSPMTIAEKWKPTLPFATRPVLAAHGKQWTRASWAPQDAGIAVSWSPAQRGGNFTARMLTLAEPRTDINASAFGLGNITLQRIGSSVRLLVDGWKTGYERFKALKHVEVDNRGVYSAHPALQVEETGITLNLATATHIDMYSSDDRSLSIRNRNNDVDALFSEVASPDDQPWLTFENVAGAAAAWEVGVRAALGSLFDDFTPEQRDALQHNAVVMAAWLREAQHYHHSGGHRDIAYDPLTGRLLPWFGRSHVDLRPYPTMEVNCFARTRTMKSNDRNSVPTLGGAPITFAPAITATARDVQDAMEMMTFPTVDELPIPLFDRLAHGIRFAMEDAPPLREDGRGIVSGGNDSL